MWVRGGITPEELGLDEWTGISQTKGEKWEKAFQTARLA